MRDLCFSTKIFVAKIFASAPRSKISGPHSNITSAQVEDRFPFRGVTNYNHQPGNAEQVCS